MLDPRVVRQSIENLKLVHPELLEDDEAWVATLESETDLNALLSKIVRRIGDTKELIVGAESRIEEMEFRSLRFSHRMESLRALLFKLMEAAELPKLELPEATISVRKGQPQLIGDVDPSNLPDDFCKISRSLNRTAIKEALKTGLTVPGFELSNAPPSLSIRIK